jgi:hypothetical protein
VTEEEWLSCNDPEKMLVFLRRKVSDRKFRLFACAFWLWQSGNFKGKERDALRESVALAERIADTGKWPTIRKKTCPLYKSAWVAAKLTGSLCHSTWRGLKKGFLPRLQADFLRDIFGNPFRPVTLDPAWATTTVKHLAQAIYTDPAFDRLPILADALEEAGCTDADILNHCRGPGPHVRGCWVVDLLLGKE